MEFDQLSTVQFSRGLFGAAEQIYKEALGCKRIDVRDCGDDGILLDKHLGIDAVLRFPSGGKITVQEKFRDNSALRYGDITFELRNGDGSPGEFSHLAAQLYFYGWATPDGTEFADWILIDVPRMKLEIERLGGIQHVGDFHRNSAHGRARFCSVPLEVVQDSILVQSQSFVPD